MSQTRSIIHTLLLFNILVLAGICEANRIVYSTVEEQIIKVFDVDKENDIPDHYIAKAIFDDKINSTGWSFLELQTSEKHSDESQAYSAGFLEGILTQELIWMHWQNLMKDHCDGRKIACDKLKLFTDKNMRWLKSMIDSQANNDPYWYQVKLYIRQFEGLADGYNKVVKNPKHALSTDQFLNFNSHGDFEDLFAKEGFERPVGTGHCSALVKIIPDRSDIFISHVTWTSYQAMLRIQKKYILNFKMSPGSSEKLKGHTMSLSSYPGLLQSIDDFYIMSSGIVSLETSIGNFNRDLWELVRPTGQILEFIRGMIANRLADSGEEWGNIFKRYNSGTFNNQWLVLDYKKFKLNGKAEPSIEPGLLWLLEQIPGTIEMQDMTSLLEEQNYFPSYSLPYFPKIFNMSKTQDMVDKFGDWFDYEKHPRAQIFKRDQIKVNNMDDMLALMRYNDFKNDPLSRCDCQPPYSAENAIASRNDLNLNNGTYPFPVLGHISHGAIDAKISNVKLAQNYQFLAVSGPAYNEKGIPPFKWSEVDFGSTLPHFGHPDDWQFEPITYDWTWN